MADEKKQSFSEKHPALYDFGIMTSAFLAALFIYSLWTTYGAPKIMPAMKS